jgi:ribonuclease BN (tRNA processing enzyme)
MTTNDVAITFLGSGDAFGSGGRFHACFMVEAPQSRFLIDCGASAPLALKRHGVDPAAIDAIVVSHLHGDHFGGIPFLALDAQYLASRQRDLVIAGPAGVEERVPEAMESMYPGLLDDEMDFAIDYVTLRAGEAADVAGTTVVPWTEDLFRVADGADLFICECSYYYEDTEGHLSYQTLLRRRADFACKRMILTHMGDDVLDRLETLELEAASDGARIVV